MAILDELRRERGLAVLLITHDIELAGAVADSMAVMYAGVVVERGTPDRILTSPQHPYSAALVGAQPDIRARKERLAAIPGRPLAAMEAPSGCPFQTRCPYAQARCTEISPALEEHAGGVVRCLRADELDLAAAAGSSV
jgi:oligopeptide/dipeptide ABC transporter ATP-binding protein